MDRLFAILPRVKLALSMKPRCFCSRELTLVCSPQEDLECRDNRGREDGTDSHDRQDRIFLFGFGEGREHNEGHGFVGGAFKKPLLYLQQ